MDEPNPFARLIQQIDPTLWLRRSWPLKGGVSAQVTALEVARPDGHMATWVVRQHGQVDRTANPQIAADEFALLVALHALGLPVPRPILVETTGAYGRLPCLVLAYVPGSSDIAAAHVMACSERLAACLAAIHAVPWETLVLPSLSSQVERVAALLAARPAMPAVDLREPDIRAALEAAWQLPTLNPLALLHGDFWPGNVLWHDGQLAAVIDWEDAAYGDPLADVANARLELLWAFGEDAMRRFTAVYMRQQPALAYTHLPYYDLYAALRSIRQFESWATDAAAAMRLRARHQAFVAQALAAVDYG